MGQGGASDYFPALLDALAHLLDVHILGVMLIGVVLGLVIGFLPGVGSLLALALLLPFTFGMSPFMAFALLLGMYSASTVASDLTAILFGIPGQPDSAALVLDGYAMSRAGMAERAMGIAATSSALGGLLGALVLALVLPVMRPIVLTVGPPESFMLTVLGATIIGTVSGRSALRGLAVAGLGLMLASVGTNPQTGIYRYTFDLLYFVDGVPLVPIAIGLFAVPEIINLHRRRTAIATDDYRAGHSSAVDGIRDVGRHWGALLRGSWIGVAFGLLPGVGGPVGQWAAYGSAKIGSKHPEQFGRGAIEGVVSPAASNNSKEGGQLIPTLAFGIPGGAAMAVLLGAFLILGLNPGPQMLSTNLNVTLFMVIVLIFGNVVGALIVFPLFRPAARLTFLRGELLFPFMLPLVLVGAMADSGLTGDLVVVVATGMAAYVMVRTGWPIVPLLVGFVLGEKAETQLALSMNIYDGVGWLLRPSVLVIAVAIAVVAFFAVRSQRLSSRMPHVSEESRPSWLGTILVGLALLGVAVVWFVAALDWPFGARVYPQVIALATAICVVLALVRTVAQRMRDRETGDGPADDVTHKLSVPGAEATSPLRPLAFLRAKRASSAVFWILATSVLVWLLGIHVAVALSVPAYLAVVARLPWYRVLAGTVLAVAFMHVVFFVGLNLSLPQPLLSW